MTYLVIYGDELYHHGVKGMKWGVRHYQNADGSYKAGAEGRYDPDSSPRKQSSGRLPPKPRKPSAPKAEINSSKRSATRSSPRKAEDKKQEPEITSMKDVIRNLPNMTLSDAKKYTETYLLGKNTIDNYITADTDFSRIQSSDAFEKYAFYATYKQHDKDMYTGLFGSNLINRANAAAKRAERAAKTDEEKEEAERLRETADNMKVYKMNISATKNLKIPSDTNTANTLQELMKKQSFRDDVAKSIADSKTQMKRPGQQMLFNRAEKIMKKTGPLSEKDKKDLYEAFNLTLTFHNDFNNRTQDSFYKALKNKGYSAIVDVNDQKYSSYHAKRPMIVFDHDAVSLKSATNLSKKDIDKYALKANVDRYTREIGEQTLGNIKNLAMYKLSDVEDYFGDNSK